MPFIIQNRMEISVFINDKEYPLGDTNLLNSLHIGASVRMSVPLLSMQITDVQHILDRMGLQDGIPIRIVIKPNGKDSKTYLFRKFNHRRQLSGGAYIWDITGYWDAPLYWNTTTSVGIQGTSNDVLSQIASTCGLKFDGINTSSDSQLWLPKNKAYRIFAKDTADNGYVSDTSCTMIGVDLDSTLRYRDVNNLKAPKKKIIAYQYLKDYITATDVSLSANSGLNNLVSGYQNMRYVQSSVNDLQTQLQNLAFTWDSKSALFNNELKTKLNRGPVRFGPIDVGNVHKNYERASYQNMRYRNLFSMGLELLIPMITDFQLMEQINFSVQREDTAHDVSNSGIYTITGHSLYVQGASYFEKLGIARHGTNENYVEG